MGICPEPEHHRQSGLCLLAIQRKQFWPAPQCHFRLCPHSPIGIPGHYMLRRASLHPLSRQRLLPAPSPFSPAGRLRNFSSSTCSSIKRLPAIAATSSRVSEFSVPASATVATVKGVSTFLVSHSSATKSVDMSPSRKRGFSISQRAKGSVVRTPITRYS